MKRIPLEGGGGGGGITAERKAYCLNDVSKALKEHFDSNDNKSDRYKLTGLIVGRDEVPLVRDVIKANMNYWDHRSGETFHFITVGFDKYFADSRIVAETIANFERDLRWQYSGRTDFILLNSMYDPATKDVKLDIENSVVLQLEDAISSGAITDVCGYFEDIVRYAGSCDGYSPTWGFSDFQGIRRVKEALLSILLMFFPKDIRNEIRRSLPFYIKDLRPQAV